MLKSTHRTSSNPITKTQPSTLDTLPPGWTEHKAPSGHTYYYNDSTKQSTYKRPLAEPAQTTEDEPLEIDFNATAGDEVVRAGMRAMQDFHAQNNSSTNSRYPSQQYQSSDQTNFEPRGAAHFTGGRSYQDHSRGRRGRQGDRPKSKAVIPNCAPWVLVKTKYGRRFVHNTETSQSLWKFPGEVMMAVIEMDRLEWDAKKKAEEQREAVRRAGDDGLKRDTAVADNAEGRPDQHPSHGYGYGHESDSYEEVEVTDSEGEGGGDTNVDGQEGKNSKRVRLTDDFNNNSASGGAPAPPPGPVEFDEDDIAYQLAAMEADYADEEEEEEEEEEDAYGYPSDHDDLGIRQMAAEDDVDGEPLPLTNEDRTYLFRALLDDFSISPYADFNSLLTNYSLMEDTRWTALPNLSSRKSAFDTWSRDRITSHNQRTQQQQSQPQPGSQTPYDAAATVPTTTTIRTVAADDPQITYLNFLSEHASAKLYYPEFKRKFRKEEIMRSSALAEKEREKLYREFAGKLKKLLSGSSGGEAERKKKDEVRDLLSEFSDPAATTTAKGRGIGIVVGTMSSNEERGKDRGSGDGACITRDTTLDTVPEGVLRDVRFYLLSQKAREEALLAYIAAL